MNSITKSATKITSIALAKFIEAGGELTSLETVNRGEGDREIHGSRPKAARKVEHRGDQRPAGVNQSIR